MKFINIRELSTGTSLIYIASRGFIEAEIPAMWFAAPSQGGKQEFTASYVSFRNRAQK
ncbi:hypothetical protein SAMN02744784_04284 [Stenotrophomonas sp. CC120223-11]|nr:hypothetical protein SAMN02744784_04284 [Stenotrophomonas sp. CC120223-11]